MREAERRPPRAETDVVFRSVERTHVAKGAKPTIGLTGLELTTFSLLEIVIRRGVHRSSLVVSTKVNARGSH